MRSRNRFTIFLGGVLVFALGLGLSTVATSHAADARGNGKNKGKIGDRCNTSDDCLQSPSPLQCVDKGDKKECSMPRPMPIPTT